MSQRQIADEGMSRFRSVSCPQCGETVSWSPVTSHTTKVTCTGRFGERGKRTECKFSMKAGEWAYLREKPHKAAELLDRFGTTKEGPQENTVQAAYDLTKRGWSKNG